MKKLIIGVAMFIGGVIGIFSVIIAATILSVSQTGVNPSLMGVIFDSDGLSNFSLVGPFLVAISLIAFGVVFAVAGYREKD